MKNAKRRQFFALPRLFLPRFQVSFSTTATLESSLLFKGYGTFNPSSATSIASSWPDLSEQYLYYCAIGAACPDGTYIFLGSQRVASNGAFAESCMPYDTARACYTNQCGPQDNFLTDMGTIEAVQLNTWDEMKAHIANWGPITTAFIVYADFPGEIWSTVYQFDSNYVWQGTKTWVPLGGHAVSCYGFDDSIGALFCKNRWVVCTMVSCLYRTITIHSEFLLVGAYIGVTKATLKSATVQMVSCLDLATREFQFAAYIEEEHFSPILH